MNIYNCCSTNDVVEDIHNGVLVCQNCGKIKEENMMIPCYEDMVECENNDNPWEEGYKHIFFKPTTRTQYYAMSNSISSKQKGREQIYSLIENICKTLSENVQMEAKNLYSILNKTNIFRGKVLTAMISCCIFNACKNVREERSLYEISKITKVDQSLINKYNKVFMKLMKNKCTGSIDDDTENTKFLIRTYINNLSVLSKKQEKMALITSVEKGLTKYSYIFEGKQKKSKIVSLIIYFLEQRYWKGIYKKDICVKLNVTVVTVNKILKQLRKFDKEHLQVENMIT
jgi:transcription initiation factor TFIIIB Brf1 subunit/transcription initiation factor TFIIB|tara:strand:+ start:998 stop:1855 length:858 start_codon:yes stop_codon:yes gene_type:complete